LRSYSRVCARRVSAWSVLSRLRVAVPQWSLAELVTAVQAMHGFDLIAAAGVVA
jgi:hypothetical protein